MALPSALSACMGITEPAIFGVNLRFMTPFVGGLAGGACGALYASLVGLGATGTGVTGIFGLLLHLHMPLQYTIKARKRLIFKDFLGLLRAIYYPFTTFENLKN